jgi:THO complex subunit 4
MTHCWQGTAEVFFSRRSHALAAIKRYNNVKLDGKPMQIEIIGTNIEAPPPPPATFSFNQPALNFNFPLKRLVSTINLCHMQCIFLP